MNRINKMKKAILIFGEKASGKTTQAQKVAERIGSYVFVNLHDVLNSHFGLSVLLQEPAVVIIEEVPLAVLDDPRIKILISEELIQVESRGKIPQAVKSPTWIFTICLNRRFEVVKV